jgi:hypothetical protein
MAARSNALSEITRFWLQECYGLLLRESIPVKLKRNNSDIDFVAASPAGPVTILNRITFKKAIIETKDERDFDPHGADFANRLGYDFALLQDRVIDADISCNFSMLKKQHHDVAENMFAGAEFSKIFIFHNIKGAGLDGIIADLCSKNIHVVTSAEMLTDIQDFFKKSHPGAGIRNSLVGDILDMLITYHGWEARVE